MAKGIMICKVCGVSYEACRTQKPIDGTFRWRDVACCPEHGQQYLLAILKSRQTDNNSTTE